MFKYTKRLISEIQFHCQEYRLRRKENAELERIESEEWRHPVAGFGFYMTMQHNRRERQKKHESELLQLQ